MTEFIRLEPINDVILVKPKRFEDERGYFFESYSYDRFAKNGIDCQFVQDNHSLSKQVGVLRGLHFQSPPEPQAKLVRCTRGRIIDYAVDIRHGSPTFGQFVSAELTAENGYQLFVPVGFAHAFCTLETNTEVQYKVSGRYAPECDAGIIFDDPELAIPWPVAADQLILSDKDRVLPRLSELPPIFSTKDRH